MGKNSARFAAGAAAALCLFAGSASAQHPAAPAPLNGAVDAMTGGEEEAPPCRKEGAVPAPGDEASENLPACRKRPARRGGWSPVSLRPAAAPAEDGDVPAPLSERSVAPQVARVREAGERLPGTIDMDGFRRNPGTTDGVEAFDQALTKLDGAHMPQIAILRGENRGQVRLAQVLLPHDGLAVDNDYGSRGNDLHDRSYQPRIANPQAGFTDKKSWSVVSPSDMRTTGARPGDWSATVRTMPDGTQRFTEGPIGDVGPGRGTAAGDRWAGEGSRQMHALLGNPITNGNAGNIPGGVRTWVFPGSKGDANPQMQRVDGQLNGIIPKMDDRY